MARKKRNYDVRSISRALEIYARVGSVVAWSYDQDAKRFMVAVYDAEKDPLICTLDEAHAMVYGLAASRHLFEKRSKDDAVARHAAAHALVHKDPVAGCVECNGRVRPVPTGARQYPARDHRPTSDGLPRDDERGY